VRLSSCSILVRHLRVRQHRLGRLEAGFSSEKFPNCSSETLKARPFQR
jgi:hypothetical protein